MSNTIAERAGHHEPGHVFVLAPDAQGACEVAESVWSSVPTADGLDAAAAEQHAAGLGLHVRQVVRAQRRER